MNKHLQPLFLTFADGLSRNAYQTPPILFRGITVTLKKGRERSSHIATCFSKILVQVAAFFGFVGFALINTFYFTFATKAGVLHYKSHQLELRSLNWELFRFTLFEFFISLTIRDKIIKRGFKVYKVCGSRKKVLFALRVSFI